MWVSFPVQGKSQIPPLPPSLDLNSSNSGCARLGSGVAPLLGVVKEEVAVLIALVRRHRRSVGAISIPPPHWGDWTKTAIAVAARFRFFSWTGLLRQ